MKLLKIEPILDDQQIKSLEGTYFSKDLIKHHITEDTKVLNENGDILAVYKKNAVPKDILDKCRVSFRKSISVSNNRGQAAGPLPADLKIGDKFNGLTVGKIGKNRFYPLLASGKLSKSPKAKAVHSSIIGFSDRYPRIPYCRRTVFTQVNKNFRTAGHYDNGDLKEGFGNLGVISQGKYDGGITVIPKYGVGLDLKDGDLAIFDVHELHGNTEIIRKSFYERISVVCYYREKMIYCGDADYELNRAKTNTKKVALPEELEKAKKIKESIVNEL
jgi:hypothetical protein